MLTAQLFSFLCVIFLLAGAAAPETPGLPWHAALPLALAGLAALTLGARRAFAAATSREDWFRVERRVFFGAIAVFAGLLYGLDLKYWLEPLTFSGKLGGLADLAGLALFFVLVSAGRLAGWARHRALFAGIGEGGESWTAALGFVTRRIMRQLPLILPWIAAVLAADLARLVLPEALWNRLPPPWDELVIVAAVLALLFLLLPPLAMRLWSCRPMPEGPLLRTLSRFCARQRFRAGIRLWPLQGGQALTAGIFGLLPRLRYLLFTPGLLAILSADELKAVTAHEIGHARRHHPLWHVALILGFSLVLAALTPRLSLRLMDAPLFADCLRLAPLSPASLAGALIALPLLALVLFYFRFVFGFFLRNFERQADAFSFVVMNDEQADNNTDEQGRADPLVSAFHRIARMSGGPKERRNWHHFSLDERVDFLRRCRRRPELASAQDRKLKRALFGYFLVVAGVCVWGFGGERADVSRRAEQRYDELVLREEIRRDPEEPRFLIRLGDLHLDQGRENEALALYEKALPLSAGQPGEAGLLNNTAWLLLDMKEEAGRDPARSLALAERALAAAPADEPSLRAAVLDTLAAALAVNGRAEEALSRLDEALRLDPKHAERFRRHREALEKALNRAGRAAPAAR